VRAGKRDRSSRRRKRERFIAAARDDDGNYASIKLFMRMSPRHWTRGEKIPWAAGPEERIQPTPHAVDEFVRYIGGAHVIDVIRWRPGDFTNSFHWAAFSLSKCCLTFHFCLSFRR
jgi:hypothetical protein